MRSCPTLPRSLNNQSLRLADLRRPEEALDAVEQAAGIYRQLAQDRPGAFLPDLAAALNNQSLYLADLRRPGGSPGRGRASAHHPPPARPGPARCVPARPCRRVEQPVALSGGSGAAGGGPGRGRASRSPSAASSPRTGPMRSCPTLPRRFTTSRSIWRIWGGRRRPWTRSSKLRASTVSSPKTGQARSCTAWPRR